MLSANNRDDLISDPTNLASYAWDEWWRAARIIDKQGRLSHYSFEHGKSPDYAFFGACPE